jgi:protein-disulfide isomerase
MSVLQNLFRIVQYLCRRRESEGLDTSCPRAARLAHQMAQLSPRVTADVIEANEFPELSRRFNVMGVPKTVVNGVRELVGAQPEAQLMAVIRAALGLAADRISHGGSHEA